MSSRSIIVSLASMLLALGCSSPECTSSSDCGAGLVCEAEKCVPESSTPSCSPACEGATPICDESTWSCVTCIATEGCPTGKVCDLSVAGGRCVECFSDAQCSGSTPACDVAAGTCVACVRDDQCSGSTPFCDTASTTCVGCTRNDQCPSATPFCDPATRSCVECLDPSGCVAPLKVEAARGKSLTEVEIDFDQAIDPASVEQDGSQISFTNGLTASAAVASGRIIRVTTSPQTPGASYTVTVAASVRSVDGVALGSSNSAEFTAPLPVARLLVNEINPNIPESHDLIEFLVVSPGTTKQLQVIEEGKLNDPTTLTTFPDVAVQAGDIVILHLNPTGDAPNASERESKSESTAPGAFPNAWDFVGGSAGVTFSHRVIKLVGPDGAVQDAVAFAKVGLDGTPPGGFPQAVSNAQGDGQWSPADCGGALCGYESTPTVVDISADWSGVGNTRDSSMSHVPGQDSNSAADWVLKPSGASFGSANP